MYHAPFIIILSFALTHVFSLCEFKSSLNYISEVGHRKSCPVILPLTAYLQDSGIVMVGWCCLCRCSGENVAHLLLHCLVARELWNYVLRRFGVDWVISGSVLDHMAGWRNWFGKHYSDVWNLVPACVMWSLWTERNMRTFENVELSVEKLVELFIWMV